MAKLRKPRPSTSTLPDSSPQRERTGSIISTSSSSSPSTATSTPPRSIALRMGRKSAASVVQPSVDVNGEFEFGDHSNKDLKVKSSSSTYSTDSIPRSSHSRNPSNASTLPPSSISPTNSHAFPTSTSLPSSTSGSALSQLRQRLDHDQLAREKATEKGKGKGHVLKKKRHDEEVIEREEEGIRTTEEGDREEEESEATQTEPIQSKGEDEELIEVEVEIMTVVEETETVIEEEEVPSRNEVDNYSTLTNTSPSTPSTPSEPPSRTQSNSLLSNGTSLVFAPARLGWRVASGTVGFGLDTTKSVVRHVPIVGRLVPSSSSPPQEEDGQEEIEPLPSPPISSIESEPISFAPSTIERKEEDSSAVRESEQHGLVYRTAELGLGLGIASVLVGNALTKMAWRRLTKGNSAGSQKE